MRRTAMGKSFLTVLLGLGIMMTTVTRGMAAGTTGGAILKTPFGARAASLSEAFTAAGDDLNVMHYNPGGLGTMTQKEIQTMYLDSFVDSKYLFLGYGQPVGHGGLGMSLLYLDGGNIDVNELNGATVITENKKAQQDFLLTLGYGLPVGGGVALGANAKVLHSTLVEDQSATAFAGDLGLHYQTPLSGLAVGAALQNVGTKLKYEEVGDPLPRTIRLGGNYSLPLGAQDRLMVGADLVLPKEDKPLVNLGLEYKLRSFMSFRGGYSYDSEDASEQITGISAGAGFRWSHYLLDYSFSLVDKLNNRHLISLGARF